MALCGAEGRADPLDDSTLRIAVFAAPLSRDGPGLLLRDILKGEDEELTAIAGVINHIDPDILLLTNFDQDPLNTTLTAFNELLTTPYGEVFSLQSNAGVVSGLDLDGDGRLGDARDAWGYGRFRGDGGMALLSRYPIASEGVRDFTPTLWRDVPGAMMPQRDGAPFPSAEAQEVWPVSSSGHWAVPIDVGAGQITLLAMDATPPVFDGPEDANGLRNRDELRVMEAVLEGQFGLAPTAPVLLGLINADPWDGEGLRDGIAGVLNGSILRDPEPASAGALADADATHQGPPQLDTVDWAPDGPGNLRVSYVLPHVDIPVVAAGVFWPAPGTQEAALLGDDGQAAGAHRLVWVDVDTSRLSGVQ